MKHTHIGPRGMLEKRTGELKGVHLNTKCKQYIAASQKVHKTFGSPVLISSIVLTQVGP